MSLLVGLDIGTSGGRCLVVDERGTRVASASRPWPHRWLGMGASELDPDETWSALVEATREALSGVDPGHVAAVGVTAQRTGLVLLDEDGTELYAGPNTDGRGTGPGMELEKAHGDLVYRTAGRLPVMLYLPARLAALRMSAPDVAERSRSALSFSDWAVFRLTGEAGTEPTQAAELLVYDLSSGEWSDELCARLDVPRSLLPPIHPPGHAVGGLAADAARALGLPSGVPTVAGGCDSQAASLGVGVTAPGSAAVVAGSTMLCEQAVDRPVIDEQRRLWTSPHLPGGFVLEAHCGESGVPLDWMAGLMGETPASLDGLAAGAEPGAGGLFFLDPAPSVAADFTLMRAGSLSFPAPLLALARSREDVARAVLEGIAFAAVAGLEWTREVGGEATEVALTGGVARSETFCRILASALNRPVRRATEPLGSALGAAVVAGVGAGLYDSVTAAAGAMADRGETVEPEPSWVGPTSGAYAGWRERMQRFDENAMRVSHMIGRS